MVSATQTSGLFFLENKKIDAYFLMSGQKTSTLDFDRGFEDHPKFV